MDARQARSNNTGEGRSAQSAAAPRPFGPRPSDSPLSRRSLVIALLVELWPIFSVAIGVVVLLWVAASYRWGSLDPNPAYVAVFVALVFVAQLASGFGWTLLGRTLEFWIVFGLGVATSFLAVLAIGSSEGSMGAIGLLALVARFAVVAGSAWRIVAVERGARLD